eukprot:TRINITY_DN2621_c0_g1_i13.p1 TRINITY_DN2621_c0_g1~~TRINITY_DN2621_c0_g1_i13.p1  ORF type:complete len:112 (+),score=14.48 TRINITY_DN2621_c0_g1_i13:1004-1339(+)
MMISPKGQTTRYTRNQKKKKMDKKVNPHRRSLSSKSITSFATISTIRRTNSFVSSSFETHNQLHQPLHTNGSSPYQQIASFPEVWWDIFSLENVPVPSTHLMIIHVFNHVP